MKICNICNIPKDLQLFRIVKKTNKPHSYCKECENKRDRERYPKRREKMLRRKKEVYNPIAKREYNQIFYYENKNYILEQKKEYYQENSKQIIEYKQQYYKDNRNAILEEKKQYLKNNRGQSNARGALRHSRKLRATPKWLTKEHKEEIKSIYILSSKMQKEDGIKRNVDHIVPLRSKLVCGLHVPWNLQILTENENCSKSNKLIGEI
jgi:hypothetical protein